MPTESEELAASIGAAQCLVDDAWAELQRGPYVQSRLGMFAARLPDVSFAEAKRRSTVGASLLNRLQSLDTRNLPHELALTIRLVRFRAQTWSREADWYWLAIDPLGIGCFGLFLPTAYCGGWLLNAVRNQMASFRFNESGDTDRYLALVADHERLIDQFTTRTEGQAQRGVRMPRVQVLQARSLLAACKAGMNAAIGVSAGRVASLPFEHFESELRNRMRTRIGPALDRALAGLSDAYLERAPEEVGIGQYPGGEGLYAELVKLHTTLELTPEEVHVRGLERMAEIQRSMREIRRELGFTGGSTEFLLHKRDDPQWRADSVAGVSAVFQRYIDRLAPRLEESFSIRPQASYGVAALPQSLQGSMTFGFYDPPRGDRGRGLYLFNGANLTQQALLNVAALTYHELMPGHHLHFATQQENASLHPFRKYSFVNAYVEGWAEYAATFAGEIGMYELPEERYGREVMDALLTSRLVVDTGMNVLGWSLERARDYMREHSGMAEAQILTESVRYSCDIPGHALAYKLGDAQIFAMRKRMHEALGSQFRLKDFHDTILKPGALPLSDLDWHVDHEIERLRAPSPAKTDRLDSTHANADRGPP